MAAAASVTGAEPASIGAPASSSTKRKLPVTVLSGFLGAGKTTLLEHILKGDHGLRIACIVNDMAELNVDAEIAGRVVQTNEQLVSMQNGCICCTLREDLLVEVDRLARDGKFDYLVIESTGVSEPLPVAETFTFDAQSGTPLSSIAKLDTMVTVIDSATFGADLDSFDRLEARGWERDGDDKRTVANLMVDQIEFANVVILNKMDLVDKSLASKVKGVVLKLNPSATVISATNSEVGLSQVLNTGLFSMAEAQKAPGWLKELRGEHTPETEEYGVSSFVFRAGRPLHPGRLYTVLSSPAFSASPIKGVVPKAEAAVAPPPKSDDGEGPSKPASAGEPEPAVDASCPEYVRAVCRGEHGTIFRSKGIAWLASVIGNCLFAHWSHTGQLGTLNPGGPWRAVRESSLESYLTKDTEWSPDADMGDRRTEVAVIGLSMDSSKVEAALRWAVVTEEEWTAGPETWSTWKDPFWAPLAASLLKAASKA